MPLPRVRPGDLRNQNQRNANADRTDVPVGWGPGAVQPSQPQALGSKFQRRVSLPGEDFPAAGSIPVDKIGESDITGGGAAASTQVITTIRVPDTYRFRIAGIGFGAEDESGLRFLSWTAFANPPATPVYGYVNMPTIGSVLYPAYVFIVLGSSVVFTINVTNNAPTNESTYHYFSRVQGWFYQEHEQ